MVSICGTQKLLALSVATVKVAECCTELSWAYFPPKPSVLLFATSSLSPHNHHHDYSHQPPRNLEQAFSQSKTEYKIAGSTSCYWSNWIGVGEDRKLIQWSVCGQFVRLQKQCGRLSHSAQARVRERLGFGKGLRGVAHSDRNVVLYFSLKCYDGEVTKPWLKRFPLKFCWGFKHISAK